MIKRFCALLICALLLCTFAVPLSAGAETAECEDGAHQFGDWVIVTASTCTEKGLQTRTCSLCGKTEEQKTNALGHDYSTDYVPIRPATCTADGTEAHKCSRCDDYIGLRVVTKTGHAFSDWAVRTPAGCLTDGEEYQICAKCQEERTRILPALGHDEVIDEPIEPKCMVNGRTAGTHCSRCGTVFVKPEIVPSTGHDVVTDEAVPATCTTDGKTEGSHCSRCGLVIEPQTTVPKLGHKTVIDEAVSSTCSVPGKTEGSHCERCGQVFFPQKELPLRSHDYEISFVPKTCTTDGYTLHTCRLCGATSMSDFDYAVGHKLVYEPAIPETCTTDGLSAKATCTVCGEVVEPARVIPALGHRWVLTVTPATTRTDGRVIKSCSICGEVKPGCDVAVAKIASIKLSQKKYICDGKKKTPTVTITDADGKTLKYKKDYKLAYDSGRKKIGTYYVTVTFCGKYAGTKALRFYVVFGRPAGLAAKAKDGGVVGLSWDKTPGAARYYIECSTRKKGTYTQVGATAKNYINLKDLKSNTTYYFRIRAFTVSTTGEKVFSGYSAPVKVTTK
ncbi:MAG: fibronectin type III domain-containing protein [Clostridia bacterium]|nr:fibronectin type III domain-containing protein [Clostridia bacterium]